MLYCNMCYEENKQGISRDSKEERSSGKKGKQELGECTKVTEKKQQGKERESDMAGSQFIL